MNLKHKRLQFSAILFTLASLIFFSCTTVKRPVHIFMAGDSTMANKVLFKTVKDSVTGEEIEEAFPERGWGMVLPEYFTHDIIIKNYAKNGRSTRSFIEEGLWDSIKTNITKGDYLIIQFGHNDASEHKVDRYTPPADYKQNLIQFVDVAQAKGAYPILCTPVVRRFFDENDMIINTHGVYPDIVREVAKEKKIPLVDLEEFTCEWINEAGIENSVQFFMHIPPGASKLYPEGLEDNTHFVGAGAHMVAELFIAEIEKQDIKGISKYLKKDK